MPVRRTLAVGLATLALPASFLLGTAQSQADDHAPSSLAASTEALAKSKVTVVAHPQLAQQGTKAAAASGAKSVFTGVVTPRKSGRPVTLQRKAGKKWAVLAKGKTKANGSYELVGTSKKGASYRVVAAKFKGAKAANSALVKVDRWLKPTWSDEFGGRTLGSVWNHRGQDYYPQSKRACSKGDPRATKVGGGTLRLSVMKNPDEGSKKCTGMKDGKPTGQFAYRLNGHVGTQVQPGSTNGFAFRYGYAAARIKTQSSRGPHSAFWMQPETYTVADTSAQAGTEIDIMEYFGDGDGMTSWVYSHGTADKLNADKGKAGASGAIGWIPKHNRFLANKKDSWSKNYHVFSVQWTPKEYIFRIDGKETWRTSKYVSAVRQYPILSLLSSDYGLHLSGDAKLPQHSYVDWIRVWETPQP